MSRRVLLAAACVVLLAPGTGGAALRACPQLADPVGDQTAPTDPAADLVAVSLSSNRGAATVVLRYAGEQAAPSPVHGHTYVVGLGTGEATLLAWADVAPSATTFELYRSAGSAGDANASGSAGVAVGHLDGRVDARAHTVTMTVPYSMVPDVLRIGRLLDVSAAVSTSIITPEIPVTGHAFATEGTDESDASTSYRLGTKGC
jgi:hypothetical protein